MNLQLVLQEIEQEVTPLFGQGQVAQYIPALAEIEPNQFAMAVTTVAGEFYGIGPVEKRFSIQSISKVFGYTLALQAYGDELFQRVMARTFGRSL